MLARTLPFLAGVAALSHPVNDAIVNQVRNHAERTWEPMEPNQNPFSRRTRDEIRGMMGTTLVPVNTGNFVVHHNQLLGFPKDYDARTDPKFQNCHQPIRDQAACGSCWAFAAAETFGVNLCAAGDGNEILSSQDLVSCDANDHGCEGGTLPNAWDYIVGHGLVSDRCLPYTAANGTVDTCPTGCTSVSGSWQKHKCPKDQNNFLSTHDDIKQGVMSLGAAETGFYVYEDFMNYKKGVYKHAEGQVLGGHAVKIIGWGSLLEKEYWLVANSWGTEWGEDGFFRIDMADRDSGFALGGAFNCGPLQPAPPTPAPPTPAAQCKDLLPSCADYTGQCSAVWMECRESCGCCRSFAKPDYCK